MLFGRELLNKGIKKRVGDGNSIFVWSDRWIEDDSDGYGLRAPWIKNLLFDAILKVSNLIDFSARRWNRVALEDLVVPSDVRILLQNQPVVSKQDFWSWNFNKSGAYSVKSGYWLASQGNFFELKRQMEALPSVNCLKALSWKISAPSKLCCFVWKALSDALSVADLVLARGMKGDDRCQLCGLEGESINHLLFQCDLARQTWAMSNIPLPKNGFQDSSIFSNLYFMFYLHKNRHVEAINSRVWPRILWFLWKNRNGFLFEGSLFSPSDILLKAHEEAEQWFMAQEVGGEAEVMLMNHELQECSPKVSFPRLGWVNCEFAMDWCKKSATVGAAWLVRDSRGWIQEHSRRSFSSISSVLDVKLAVLLWVIESMISLKKNKVVFVSDFQDMVDAVLHPVHWPALQFQASELRVALQDLEVWNLQVVVRGSLRGVSFIEQSVNNMGLWQSYVAAGHPRWLDLLFVDERAPYSL